MIPIQYLSKHTIMLPREFEELHNAIDTLDNEGVATLLGFAEKLKVAAEYIVADRAVAAAEAEENACTVAGCDHKHAWED